MNRMPYSVSSFCFAAATAVCGVWSNAYAISVRRRIYRPVFTATLFVGVPKKQSC